MSHQTPPQVVRSYLSQLEAALDGVPSQSRRAILNGAAEELAGLDAPAAATRIEELGDPEFIAAEARAEAGGVAGSAAPATPGAVPPVASVADTSVAPAASAVNRRSGDAGWYIVLSSLLVAFGGVVVPLLGWVFGLAMVWVSKSWWLWEKWVATLTPPLGVAFSVVILWLLRGAAGGVGGGSDPSQRAPALADSALSNVFLLIGLNAVVGIWLLWRSLRASPRPTTR